MKITYYEYEGGIKDPTPRTAYVSQQSVDWMTEGPWCDECDDELDDAETWPRLCPACQEEEEDAR